MNNFWPKLIPNQVGGNSALTGELGGHNNPHGGYSTEYSSTVPDPRNDGWMNIPMFVRGQVDLERLMRGGMTPEQEKIAIRRALERYQQGQELPSYDSRVDAGTMAAWRSMIKDLGQKGLLNDE